NTGTPPGLRVRLAGPPGNPDGLGAVVTAIRGNSSGSAQTVTGGGGYCSQASAVMIFGGARPSELSIRWPGGKISRVQVPPEGHAAGEVWFTARARHRIT